MKLIVKSAAIAAVSLGFVVSSASAGTAFDFMPRYSFAEEKVDVSKNQRGQAIICVAETGKDKNAQIPCEASAHFDDKKQAVKVSK